MMRGGKNYIRPSMKRLAANAGCGLGCGVGCLIVREWSDELPPRGVIAFRIQSLAGSVSSFSSPFLWGKDLC